MANKDTIVEVGLNKSLYDRMERFCFEDGRSIGGYARFVVKNELKKRGL